MSAPALPEFSEFVGYGLLLGGFAGLLPTSAGAPVAVVLGVTMVLLGWWLR